MTVIKDVICPICHKEIKSYKMFYEVPNIVNYKFKCPVCMAKVSISQEKYTILDKFM